MRINRILLVSSPLDGEDGRQDAVNSYCFPPLGLLKIAARLRREFSDMEIHVLDGDMIGLSAVNRFIECFQPDVVGVSVLTPCYRSALTIANHSRSCGASHVVFGNDHASFFPELILRRHPDVSHVIVGDNGDQDFADLMHALRNDSIPFETVHSLYGTIGREVRFSSIPVIRKPTQPFLDGAEPEFLSDMSIAKYDAAYALRFGRHHKGKKIRPFIINNAKGCYKANDRCFYCSIYDLQMNTGNVSIFWNRIERYWKDYGFNLFFEVCDNFSGMKAYRRALVQCIPPWFEDSDIELMVYADANRICRDPDLLEDFRRLHVKRVNLGLDSGDSRMLRMLKGFQDAELNKKAIALLSSQGIQVHCSFVLGGPGENEESILNTVSLVTDAIAEPSVVAIEVSPLFPLPSAPVWNIFLGTIHGATSMSIFAHLSSILGVSHAKWEAIWQETRHHFWNNDVIDLTLASRLWLNYFTLIGHASVNTLANDLNKRIADAGKVTGGFG